MKKSTIFGIIFVVGFVALLSASAVSAFWWLGGCGSCSGPGTVAPAVPVVPTNPDVVRLGGKCGEAAAQGDVTLNECYQFCTWHGKNRGWDAGDVDACQGAAQEAY